MVYNFVQVYNFTNLSRGGTCHHCKKTRWKTKRKHQTRAAETCQVDTFNDTDKDMHE